MSAHREPEPLSSPPAAVMRSAFTWTVPFGILWAIGAVGIWLVILDRYGATWPGMWHEPPIALAAAVIGAIFGAICAVGVRLFLWLFTEQRRKRSVLRPPRVRPGIKTAQDWQEI